ncbi:MAG: hypothetical protein LBC87_12110 [Fibromonadaceae bacterium]|jgi:Na+/phosphate symporter|nr:hypothetical protein [Fibromonadaceae bacterium]
MDNTAFKDSLKYIIDKYEAKINGISDINEKKEFLEKEISEYKCGHFRHTVLNESSEKTNVRMIEAIIHYLQISLSELNLGRPINNP